VLLSALAAGREPALWITSPSNNASLDATRVNVLGSITKPSLKDVSVNGVRAYITGNAFEAVNVLLQPGTNRISVTAIDAAGKQAASSIVVVGRAEPKAYQIDPVRLLVEPAGGFAPLQVTFKVQAAVPGRLTQVLYDFDGDHVTDKAVSGLEPVTHEYAEPGERFPVATVETTVGRFSSVGWGSVIFPAPRVNVQALPVVLRTLKVVDPVDLKCTKGGDLYILSGTTATISEFSSAGKVVRALAGIGPKSTGFDVDGAGNVLVAVSGRSQIWKFRPTANAFEPDRTFGTGGFIGSEDGRPGSAPNQLNAPFDIAVAPNGQEIVVSDCGNHRIQRFTKDGAFVDSFGQKGPGDWQFKGPKGLAFDDIGQLFIADSGHSRVVVALEDGPVAASGEPGRGLGQFGGLISICAGSRGIWVTEAGNNRLQLFDAAHGAEGGRLAPFSPRVAISTELGLSQPGAVAWVHNPLEEECYVADTSNNRVLLVRLPLDNPEATWNAMKRRLLVGDVEGAIPYFACSRAETYRESFRKYRKAELIQMAFQMPPIIPLSVGRDTAEYRFNDKQSIMVPIEFVKEKGAWKILDY